MKNEEPLNVEDIPSTLTESSQQRTLLDKNDDIEPAQEVEHADQSEDSPIDIIRSTIHTVDNPRLPVFTYVRISFAATAEYFNVDVNWSIVHYVDSVPGFWEPSFVF
jgi:hypothetical protein